MVATNGTNGAAGPAAAAAVTPGKSLATHPLVEKHLLRGPKTAGYRPSVASTAASWAYGPWGQFNLSYVDEMLRDDQVSICLGYKQQILYTAEFEVAAGDRRVREFVAEMIHRFWQRSLPVALESMAYGYIAAEALYSEENGVVKFDNLQPLHPKDAKIYTCNGALQFIRVKSLADRNFTEEFREELEETDRDLQKAGIQPAGQGGVDLQGAEECLPAKGCWFVFQPRFSRWFGRSALMPAWWPWRIKTMPDGAMEIVLKWYYKHAYSGMLVRHPNELYETEEESSVQQAQDFARQMGEQAKTGANFALPSARDESGNYVWAIESYGEPHGSGTDLLTYLDYLNKFIQRGIGIPDEVLTHEGNTGGYSRSQVAMTAFVMSSQHIVDRKLEEFDAQICRPLVRLNFGRNAANYRVRAKPLIAPQQPGDDQGGGGGEPGQPPRQGNPLAGLAGGEKPASGGQMQLSTAEPIRFATGERKRRRKAAATADDAVPFSLGTAERATFYTRLRRELRSLLMEDAAP